MKKYFIYLIIFAAFLILNSCREIIDADPNVSITKISYTKVLDNQSTSVIMPLKPGNQWIYKVTKYDMNGSMQSQGYDTIRVLSEININGEKWFNVINPLDNAIDTTLLTNTDVGLWLKCNCNDSKSRLKAQYPVNYQQYFSGDFQALSLTNGNTFKTYMDTMNIWAKAENISNFVTPTGNYNCIKYRNWLEKKTLNADPLPDKVDPYMIEYYVPDFGLLRRDQYYPISNTANSIQVIYELVSQNITGGGCLEQKLTEKDFGNITLGASEALQIPNILINNSPDTVKIMSIIFESPNGTTTKISDYPQYIQPGNSFYVTILVEPTSVGAFEVKVTIQTTCGEYTFKVNGKGV